MISACVLLAMGLLQFGVLAGEASEGAEPKNAVPRIIGCFISVFIGAGDLWIWK